MKKFILFVLLASFFIFTFSSEVFVQEGGKIFKVVLSDNGDTLSKEEIKIVPIDTAKAEEPLLKLKEPSFEDKSKTMDEPAATEPAKEDVTPNLYNPQLLRIVPFKWQSGWYGAWQGFYYGFALTQGLGISEKRYAPLVWLSTPALMFFLPPILIKDDVPDYALAFTDWGYRLGPADYMVAKAAISKDYPMTEDSFSIGSTYHKYNIDALAAVSMGYAESWGGYTLARKLGPFKRAASDMYAAGAYMGYVWGGLIGGYLAMTLVDDDPEAPLYDPLMDTDTVLYNQWMEENDSVQAIRDSLNQLREQIGFPVALLTSIGLRATGFYFGNQEKYGLKSFDGYFYTFNSITGFLLANEIDNYTNINDEMLLIHTAMSMLTTGATAYLMKDIHLDDGNAILMMIGGVVGGTLGQGIELVIESYTNENFASESKFHTSIGAICMLAGEFGVYMLRKDAIKSGTDFGSNVGFNVYPTRNNGLGMGLSYRF